MESTSEGMWRADRSESSVELERREMLVVIGVLLQRLGGGVEITGEELEDLRAESWEVVSTASMLKYSLALKLHKFAPAIEVDAQPAIGA